MRLNLCTKSLTSWGLSEMSCTPTVEVTGLYRRTSIKNYTVVLGSEISWYRAAIILVLIVSCAVTYCESVMSGRNNVCSARCLRYL